MSLNNEQTMKEQNKKNQPKRTVSQETLDKVVKVMKRFSSRKTGKISVSRTEIATAADIHVRTVDTAINNLKATKVVSATEGRYKFI